MSKKLSLLAVSTAISLVSATGAQALIPNVYPAAAINGNGASSIANVLVQELNCYGGPNNPLGFGATGTTATIPDHAYHPLSPTVGNPNYDCASQSVQPNIDGHYVSTGSGAGKNNWKNLNTAGIVSNPFTYGSNIHFAFSDSPISSGDLATYNSTAAPTTGAAIQIPLYVLPIAVAYSPVYGKKKTASGISILSFNVKFPHADATGGLRLKKSTYCGIFNGTITNWNDPALKADNGGQSLMSLNDDVTRWNTTGVPIRLVGRLDNSGSTNIFTRHLTAVCGGTVYTAGGTDQLPAAAQSTAVYDSTTGALTSGTEVDGKFGRSSGSNGVAAAVDIDIPNPTTVGAYAFNGRMGYLGADWVAPSTLSGSGLSSADLQIGTSSGFAAATAANATKAFTDTPPESASTGKYLPTAGCNSTTANCRANPLSWAVAATATTGVANPTLGYPITGTTNGLFYTCYADNAVRNAIQGLLLLHFGKVATDSTGAKVPVKLVTSTAKGTDGLQLGILPKNGIAPLPAKWSTAILETFVTKVTSGSNPSNLGLWIQNIQPKKTADVAAAVSNPSCTAGVGA